MNLQRRNRIPFALVAAVIAAASLLGCSDAQEAEPENIPQKNEEEIRTVVFDREGVLEIREGEDVVFERAPGNSNQLPRGLMPDASAESEEIEDSDASEQQVATEPQQASAAESAPPKTNVPAKIDVPAKPVETLSEDTPAKLEPLPEKIAPLVPHTTFAVQVGFFGQRSNAENLRDVLTNNDWPVRLITIEKKSGKKFYLVAVPVRGDKERANAAKGKIQKQHGLDGIVIRTSSLPK